jgi:hypothetical protein
VRQSNENQETAMAVRLLPLTVSELCGHALELERDSEQRFREYTTQMHAVGAHGLANVFEDLAQQGVSDIAALEAASGTHKAAQLSPWEYAWRLTYMPEGMEHRPRLVPRNAREALQLAVQAKRRALAFYDDVADNARDTVVRGCASEMAQGEKDLLKRLERMLASEILGEKPHAGEGGNGGDRLAS